MHRITIEVFKTVLGDLDERDPLYPAALVHVTSEDAKLCYDAVAAGHSTYVIGRGPIPGGGGYFLTASRPDYATLREALVGWFPMMPQGFPSDAPEAPLGISLSQEMSDVVNYVAIPPIRDRRIYREACDALPGLVEPRYVKSTARVCRWLRENMLPANNCYTLAALLTRWLVAHGCEAAFRTGRAVLQRDDEAREISHAWVEVEGQVCDLTVDTQRAWGDVAGVAGAGSVRHLGVDHSAIAYHADAEGDSALEQYWFCFTKPDDRPPYTKASLRQQDDFIRQAVPTALRRKRAEWITLLRAHGILDGTYRLLHDIVAAG